MTELRHGITAERLVAELIAEIDRLQTLGRKWLSEWESDAEGIALEFGACSNTDIEELRATFKARRKELIWGSDE